MNSTILAKAAGVDVGSLNVWVSRHIVPGIRAGKPGNRRSYDFEGALNVMIIAELGRFGISAFKAGKICALRKIDDEKLLILSDAILSSNRADQKYVPLNFAATVRGIKTDASLMECVRLGLSLGPVVTVIDVRALRDRLAQIERETETSLDMVA